MSDTQTWQQASPDIFWSEIAPCDHVLQIYDTDEHFLRTLTSFVGTGINAGDCTIVIATQAHLDQLEKRLQACGLHLQCLKDEEMYMPLNAESTLASFMVDGWPDKDLFETTIRGILDKAYCKNRKIRAFGEMVAILWAQGNNGATVALEALWNKLMHQAEFSLFCAYPKSGFTQDINKSINDICSCHSRMIEPLETNSALLSYTA